MSNLADRYMFDSIDKPLMKKLNYLAQDALLHYRNIRKEENKNVFLPVDYVERIIYKHAPDMVRILSEKDELGGAIADMSILLHFMYTRGSYKISKELFESIYDENVFEKTPVNIFHRMPQHSLYIDLTEVVGFEFGAFCHMIWDYQEDKKIHASALFCNAIYCESARHYFQFPTGGPVTIKEALDKIRSQNQEYHDSIGTAEEMKSASVICDEGEVKNAYAKIISVLLYICSQEADIELYNIKEPNQKNQRPKKIENNIRLKPALKTKEWIVGRNLERQVQEYNYYASSGYRGVRPHIRRGHWHGYWKGSAENKECMIKWLAPIIVKGGAKDED